MFIILCVIAGLIISMILFEGNEPMTIEETREAIEDDLFNNL